MKWVVALFTLVPLIFLGVGTYLAWSQDHKIRTYKPVRAVVLSKEVETRHSTGSRGSSTSYIPHVAYRYQVNGQAYTCDTITPLNESRSRSWAYGVVNSYQVNQEVEAYYNPSNPSEAFLRKQYSFFPYLFLLFPMLFFAIAAGVGVGAGLWHKASEPSAAGSGWYELRPTTCLSDRRRAAFLVSVLWHAFGALAWGHYFQVATPPYETMAIVATIIYEAIGLVPVGMLFYYIRLGRIVRDAYVLIGTPQPTIGQDLPVHVEQEIFTNLQLDELSLGLVCEKSTKTRTGGKTSYSTSDCYEDRAAVLSSLPIREGEAVVADHTFRIPEGQSPSSPPGYKDYPRFAWHIEVKTKIPDQPDYRARFRMPVFAKADSNT